MCGAFIHRCGGNTERINPLLTRQPNTFLEIHNFLSTDILVYVYFNVCVGACVNAAMTTPHFGRRTGEQGV